MSVLPDRDLLQALTAGPATGAELQARLGVSQPSLSRRVSRGAADILAVGRARATRYARRRALPGLSAELPVYRIDPAGEAHEVGLLTPIYGGFAFEDREQGNANIYPGLPWFLSDMRPQGFIGRAFLQRNDALGLPPRLSDWSDDHALVALARRGEDTAGNLIVGEESFTRWGQTRDRDAIPEDERASRYPALAERALSGELPGSSAGGEQPKFTTLVEGAEGARHVLVKFTGPLTSPTGRRWADLLVCEHLALNTITDAGLPAAHSELIEAGGRMFLEVTRFDRVGARGRLGLVSLGSVDDQLIGQRRDWSATARALVNLRRLTREDADRIAWLQAFGVSIGNSDMHFGNLSLHHSGESSFTLAPAYDMLPMRYAPTADGEVRTPEWREPVPPPLALSQWASAQEAALNFGKIVRRDGRISSGPQELNRLSMGLNLLK